MSLVVVLLTLGGRRASADLSDVLPEFSNLGRWTVFTLGAFNSRDELGSNGFIQGYVGVAGAGDIVLGENSTIQGDLYSSSSGTPKLAPGATVTGAQIRDQDSLLENCVAAAFSTSRRAASLNPTFSAPADLELAGSQNFTATGAPGETVVLKLGSLSLSDNSSFTLEGTATTTFVINVSKRFSLTDNARIVLAGGVQWSNVLFNIRGRNGAVSLSGSSSFAGILMANLRTIRLADQAGVAGELIANKVVFKRPSSKGGATVDPPSLVSP